MLDGLMVDGLQLVEEGGHDRIASSDKYEVMNQELIHMTKMNVNQEEQNKENRTGIGVYQYIFG